MLQYIGTVARDKYARISFACHLSKRLETALLLHFWNLFPAQYMEASNVYEIHVENAINCLVGCARFKQTVTRDKDNGVIQLQKHNSDATARESYVSFSNNLQMIKICQFSTIKALSDDIYANQNKNNNDMMKPSPFETLMNVLEAEGSNPRLRGDIRNEVKDILGEVKFVGDKKRKAAKNSNLLNADLNAKQKQAKLERAKYWKRRNVLLDL